jgi:hypothetical protein
MSTNEKLSSELAVKQPQAGSDVNTEAEESCIVGSCLLATASEGELSAWITRERYSYF